MEGASFMTGECEPAIKQRSW